MNAIGQQITVVATAIIGVAILAVLLSKQSDTSNVIGAAGAGFSHALQAALTPLGGAYTGSY